MKRLWVILFLILSTAWGQTSCQYDGLKLSNTYESKIENGKKAYLWKCINGHQYWIVANTYAGTSNLGSFQYGTDVNATIDNLLGQLTSGAIADSQQRAMLEQQERIALAKMTPEQREEYYRLKNEEIRIAAEQEEIQKQRIRQNRAYTFGTAKGLLEFTGTIVGCVLVSWLVMEVSWLLFGS
jgi:hypothetical protein|tara:strand:- start:536 stop:1084 length:549 start_codon:yes stop_codon:yes gene_type:complete